MLGYCFLQTAKDLRSLQKKHDHGLQKSEGITVRPRIACTNAAEKALQLKRKYKQLRLQASKYNSLPEKQRGRPRFNAVYRNRVGKKAATKQEVYIYITCNKIYKLNPFPGAPDYCRVGGYVLSKNHCTRSEQVMIYLSIALDRG